eukprot:TRINITY_DN9350_c1_g1_i1.p2 TRINITY_DN9350_c1_g1~~TRINITY_DN9350_c1_g1_i1.p2  ORF type:complete len:282 (+),score=53.59 TRINITY_DN9350_c1_g1_i1:250-1095(+)
MVDFFFQTILVVNMQFLNVSFVKQSVRASYPVHRQRGVRYQNRAGRVQASGAELVVKEQGTGVEFPLVRQFWAGDKCRCLGAAERIKQILILKAKVYAVSLYVESELAARELGVRSRGGYFDANQDQEYCDAILDGAFVKCVILHMVRSVDGQAIFGALDEALRPRLQVTGELGKLQELQQIFEGSQFEDGDEVLLMWLLDGTLNVHINKASSKTNRHPDEFSKISPQHTIQPSGMTRALFEVYLGQNGVIPQARAAWAQGARVLLETDTVRRNTYKSGSG